MADPMICPGCRKIADPDGIPPTLTLGLDRWHLACVEPRQRFGIADAVPPLARPGKPPPARPVSQDQEAMRRLRRR